uniref:Endonuclease/exonuclease/phosphatase domain-containing protein n=1 Tax=Anguilla anguilla TaxID=7936 RepID=A0A0E9TZ40_ANGAN
MAMKCASPVLFLTIFCPPKKSSGFIDDFTELLSKISTDFDCIVISGDFNIHIDNHTDTHARELISLLEAFGLSQHVSRPRQSFFSKIISENANNTHILFSTVDRLVNPPSLIARVAFHLKM